MTAAHFSYPKPASIASYQDTFACEILFAQPRDELIIPAAVLDMPVPTANPLVHEVAVRQCQQSERLARPGAALVEQIRGILLSDAARCVPLPQVAERLGISQRTLQRRLTAEGTSFRDVALQTRYRLAQDLLRTHLPIKEIAFLTGYADVASFSAAFKSVCGIPPSKYLESPSRDA